MITRSAHPAWCESPNAPDDDTHTAAVGSVPLPRDITAEMVLAQMPRTPTPQLTVHVTGPARRISVDMTGVESWALAGVLIDATVAHRQAITDPVPPPMRDRSSTRGLDREPSWWCDCPEAPADATHTHTRALGVVDLDDGASVDAVMVQAGDDAAPSVTLHVVTRHQQVSIAADGQQVWLLAGILVDATVSLRRARQASEAATVPDPARRRPEPARTRSYLVRLARRRSARMSSRVRRAFRCLPVRPDESGGDDTGQW